MNDPTNWIPFEALDEHSAIVGKTGSGKTYTAKGCAEKLLGAGRQVVIVDPTGVWWGLRSRADGQAAGFPVVVFGGAHADVPIAETAGHQLASIVVARRLSCVVDVSEFTTAQRVRFLAGFLDGIYADCRSPLHLILDEADVMAPQRPMPDQTTLLNRTEQIVRRGRSRGLRTILITQRPAVLHKDVLSQAAMLIAMKMTAPQDRNALGAWIEGQADREQGKAVLASLPQMKVGEGWVWWPEGDLLQRTTFLPIATFDSSRTPEHGEAAAAPVLAPVAIDELRAALAPIPPVPGRIIPGSAPAAQMEAARKKGMREGLAMGEAEMLRLRRHIQSLNAAIESARKALNAPGITPIEPAARAVVVINTRPVERPSRAAANGTGGAEMRILGMLAARRPARLTEAQWATLAGMSRRGGTWATYKSKLKVAGLIVVEAGLWACTPAGTERAGAFPAEPQTPEDTRGMWKRALGTGPGRMIDALVLAEPHGLTRYELGEKTDMTVTGGTFATYLSKLRSNELVVNEGATMRLAEALR